MSKINNPFYGKVGAFWIEGHEEPFYGIEDAKKYQVNKGGDILNYRGEVIIHQPEQPAVVEEQTIPQPHPIAQKKKKKGFFNFFGS